jgi:small subunit ribosomal protein S17
MAKETDQPAPEEQSEPGPEASAPETDAPVDANAATDAEETAAPTEAQAEAPAEASAEAEAPAEAEAAATAAEVPASEEEAPAEAEPSPPPRKPEEEISPKERRRRARSLHVGEPRPARSPEERHAGRLAERRAKAVRRRARRLQERAKAAAAKTTAGAAGEREPELAPVHGAAEGKRKVRQGIVVSDKAQKTIVVRIDVARRHRRYSKIVRSSSMLHAHDENNDARQGDVVRVIESRPLSRTKRWRLVEVLERAQ